MAGRPREFDRNQALRRALDLFWQRGYEGVSMADLVQTLGLASARIYAAFGSKEALFREAVELYDREEGGFGDRALREEPSVLRAFERMLEEAIELYARVGRPNGCFVVSAATNCTTENESVRRLLEGYRSRRTASLVECLNEAIKAGRLQPEADAQMLGDYYATVLHGLSVQARDGVSSERLRATLPLLMLPLQPYVP
ncbi:TetR family transcriptional regulator [Rhizobium lusitanum]|uniref:TetR family transcriptional regulator n=1 Tax=Rhizobium lusitanum TaxID=293958 RepID=A0A6L9UJ25_9HYPH|nr:TetR/AcrR family transcriptional regulator [Rhizobium lusitanum]NEI74382.1 TetR family transcriptional regulator [Rhizobium lusitanum]